MDNEMMESAKPINTNFVKKCHSSKGNRLDPCSGSLFQSVVKGFCEEVPRYIIERPSQFKSYAAVCFPRTCENVKTILKASNAIHCF